MWLLYGMLQGEPAQHHELHLSTVPNASSVKTYLPDSASTLHLQNKQDVAEEAEYCPAPQMFAVAFEEPAGQM